MTPHIEEFQSSIKKFSNRVLDESGCLMILLWFLTLSSCQTIDDTRIPSMAVSINLSDPGVWATYGVAGFGSFNYFILQSNSPISPSGFTYLSNSATGFGGVLLIEGMDPFTAQTGVPLAYDLACPVEKQPTIRVAITGENYEAVCPVCDSHYDVTMGAGAPTAGPALTGEHKYGLRRYYCHPTSSGGYIINDLR